MSKKCVIGIDLGGTNVRAGAFYEDGQPAGQDFSVPSHAQEGNAMIFDAIIGVVSKAIAASEVPPVAIGLAIPGHIDNERGMVLWAPNFGETVNGIFHHWLNVPVRQPLAQKIDLPMAMGNDANLAALGEYKFGSGRDSARCLVMLTLGTGIGGGVILSPHSVLGDARGPLLLLGGNQGGAELGHTIVLAGGLANNSGSYGALEGYCRRDAIVERAIYKLQRGRASFLTELVEGDLSKVTPRLISEAANQGDAVAIEVWREIGHFLGVGVGSIINVFAPDIFAIGGNIAKAGEILFSSIRESASSVAVPSLFQDCRIQIAEQIDDAGMLGGAALAIESTKWAQK